MIDLSASLRKTSYFAKDQAKASRATRFIGRGSPHSSTAAYARAAWPNANCGEYTHEDIVFISAEGARKGRLDPDYAETATGSSNHAPHIAPQHCCANTSPTSTNPHTSTPAPAAPLPAHIIRTSAKPDAPAITVARRCVGRPTTMPHHRRVR